MALDVYMRDNPTMAFRADSFDTCAERGERDWHAGDIEALGMKPQRITLDDGREVDGHVSRDGLWALVERPS